MVPGERYNATVDLLERNLAPTLRDRPYLRTAARTLSFGEVSDAADGAGIGLLDLGMVRGRRVLLHMRDRPEFVAAFWGALKAGLVAVPVAQGLTADDLHFIITDSGAGAVVCDASSAGTVIPALEGTSAACVVVGDRSFPGARPWSEVCAPPGRLEPAPTVEEDIGLWLYTSGTTGQPKAVMHRHRDLKLAPEALSRQVLRLGPGDTVLSISKMFFGYGLGNSVYLPAAAGASSVIDDAPAVPPRIQMLLNRFDPTVMLGVPSFFGGFSRLPDSALPQTVRMVLSAGEALPVPLFEQFRTRFGLPLLDGLGSSEALHHVTSNVPDDVVPGSAGRPLHGWDAEVRDGSLRPLPEGERGELWIRGPTMFAGYWRRPELNSVVFDGGWMRTGDLVRIRDGRIFYEGRLDDLFKLGGVWIAPREIEAFLRSHPDVVDAAVVPAEQESGVPIVKAFLVSDRPGGDLSRDLIRLCRGRLATFKIPASFQVVSDLPRTPTGKLKRFVLRERGGG